MPDGENRRQIYIPTTKRAKGEGKCGGCPLPREREKAADPLSNSAAAPPSPPPPLLSYPPLPSPFAPLTPHHVVAPMVPRCAVLLGDMVRFRSLIGWKGPGSWSDSGLSLVGRDQCHGPLQVTHWLEGARVMVRFRSLIGWKGPGSWSASGHSLVGRGRWCHIRSLVT